MQGRQWEQRWVQLTSQTFTYAKTEKDMLSGRYKVFKTSELIGTMPGPNNVFQVGCSRLLSTCPQDIVTA